MIPTTIVTCGQCGWVGAQSQLTSYLKPGEGSMTCECPRCYKPLRPNGETKPEPIGHEEAEARLRVAMDEPNLPVGHKVDTGPWIIETMSHMLKPVLVDDRGRLWRAEDHGSYSLVWSGQHQAGPDLLERIATAVEAIADALLEAEVEN